VRGGEVGYWGKNGVLIGKGKETLDKVGKGGTNLSETSEKWGNGALISWKKCLKSVKV
jgi:hypothetical protein